MKIKDVSLKTGLSKKTIRFYEAEGLVTPEKTYQNGRAYRSYSEENLETLSKIAVLRRARFSVEEIRQIQQTPDQIPAIFQRYRERLHRERKNLEQVLKVADAIEQTSLTSEAVLVARMQPVTAELPLPAADMHPHFRYLDLLEENMMKKKKKINMTEDELRQHRIAAENAALYAGFSVQNNAGNNVASGGKGGGFDISNAQKIAAYNLLMNNKDD